MTQTMTPNQPLHLQTSIEPPISLDSDLGLM